MVNEEDFKLQTCFHCGNIGLLRIVHKYSWQKENTSANGFPDNGSKLECVIPECPPELLIGWKMPVS